MVALLVRIAVGVVMLLGRSRRLPGRPISPGRVPDAAYLGSPSANESSRWRVRGAAYGDHRSSPTRRSSRSRDQLGSALRMTMADQAVRPSVRFNEGPSIHGR